MGNDPKPKKHANMYMSFMGNNPKPYHSKDGNRTGNVCMPTFLKYSLLVPHPDYPNKQTNIT